MHRHQQTQPDKLRHRSSSCGGVMTPSRSPKFTRTLIDTLTHALTHATAWKRKRKYAQFFNKTMFVSWAKGDNNNNNKIDGGKCKMISRKVFLAFSLNFSCTCTKLFKFLAVCLSLLFAVFFSVFCFSSRLCFKCVSHIKNEFLKQKNKLK